MKNSKNQSGMTLLELMIGIAIGLMAIATALGALLVSRGLAGTTNEASALQQQAAYISRVIGSQLRLAGAVQLNLKFGASIAGDPGNIFDKVAFTTSGMTDPAVIGKKTSSNTTDIKASYQNYQERMYSSSAPGWTLQSQFSDCAGGSTATVLTNTFRFIEGTSGSPGKFSCSGSASPFQPISNNLLQFTANYIYQTNPDSGNPFLQNLTDLQIEAGPGASARDRWAPVVAVNTCFVLSGTEYLDTNGGTYIDCDGSEKSMNNKLVMIFKNTYQIRSQGYPI